MALFAIERYMGEEEDEDSTVVAKQQASSILQKLQENAAKKKLKQSKSPKHNKLKNLREANASDPNEENVENAKTNKCKTVLNERECVQISEGSSRSEKKKLKRKVKEDNSDSVAKPKKSRLSLDSQEDVSTAVGDDGEDHAETKTPKKKIKFKKEKSRDSSENEDSSDEENDDMVDESNETGADDEGNDMDQGTEDQEADTPEDSEPGFKVLGQHRRVRPVKVHRVLPTWLSQPTIIDNNLSKSSIPVEDLTCLDTELQQKLKQNGITQFFPVQRQVIPALLQGWTHGQSVGAPSTAGYIPTDLCCSAPTGSGKTLAFVLPIVQALKQRVVCRVRALVVLPVRDLATQVYKVFCTYAEDTPLKVALVVGQKPMHKEQQNLVRMGVRGPQSLADIVVATPGRLVDHMNHTAGFSLKHLRYLVIDEADRMMDEIKQDWLVHLEACIRGQDPNNLHSSREEFVSSLQRPLTVANAHCEDIPPLQKLLFSATLSQNPEKLQHLHLVQPRLITAVVPSGDTNGESGQISNKAGEFIGKYTTPTGLTEYLVQTSLEQKPLAVLHFLMQLKFRHILCFTNSVEATHRLYLLVKQVGGLEVQEFSANLPPSRRNKILKSFAAGKIDLLICSDAMARGMDVDNVKCVLSYDCPRFLKTYIHRIGRTARAGRVGTAITLLEKKEIFHFKKMIKEAGKPKVKELKVTRGELRPLEETYKAALQDLQKVIEMEKKKKAGR